MSLRLICSMIVITTSLSKLCVLVLCKKCSVSSQLLTLLLIWFLWLLSRRLKPVSLFPIYCNLQILLSIDYINYPSRLTIHCMECVVEFAVQSSFKRRGLVYTITLAASRFVARSATTRYVVIPSSSCVSKFCAYECLEDFSVACMLLMVVLEKCGLIFPSIGGSAIYIYISD